MTVAPPLTRRIGRRQITNRAEDLLHLWSVRLPTRLDPWVPRLADAFADGMWTGVWRPVGAYLPVATFVLGFLIPGSWPGATAYSESLLFLAIAVAIPILSGSAGVLLLAGHIVRTLLSYDVASSLEILLHRGGGLLVSFLLLALPTVILPSLARAIAEVSVIRLRFLSRPATQLAARAVLLAVVAAALTLVWCQAMIVLMRPFFLWVRSSPTYESIRHFQEDWSTLCWVAAGAAILRIVLGGLVAPRSPRAAQVRGLRRERSRTTPLQGQRWLRLPVALRIVVVASGITLALAGTYERWADALIAGVAIAGFAALHEGIPGLPLEGWSRLVRRIPAALRFIAASGLGYLLALSVLKWMWEGDTLRPAFYGALLSLGAFYLFFPRPPKTARPTAGGYR